ncbi:MAG: GTPase HflX [Dehalococcoidia bacterium]|nr:GTPase HflX [Dehalococcoidia bacterium]
MPLNESLRELSRLIRTAGGSVVGTSIQRRQKPDPATYIGIGKLEEIAKARKASKYNMVVFDEPLSPSQQLNIENILEVKVLDRSALILDIFASRAHTREASLQVELAQHEYLLPRLRGQWQHLERTEGAIGTRGPGETQLETDRRLIGSRISRLKQQIENVRKQRTQQRSRRNRYGMPSIALIGYTNAGKSSLLRSLAGADVLIADAPFATLDPVTRRIGSQNGESILVTDTVGFMQKLPTQLMSAFRATLEELTNADLFLHVVDSETTAMKSQYETVLDTLGQLGLSDVPIITVLNKADLLVYEGIITNIAENDLDRLPIPHLDNLDGDYYYISATENWGIAELRDRLIREFFGS